MKGQSRAKGRKCVDGRVSEDDGVSLLWHLRFCTKPTQTSMGFGFDAIPHHSSHKPLSFFERGDVFDERSCETKKKGFQPKNDLRWFSFPNCSFFLFLFN